MHINTNSPALFAQRHLAGQQQHLGKAMERLSGGLRINSASDDVAGLAISNRMTARIRSLNQVQRNANDGISLLQTADAALGNIGGILQRIREIGVQAGNDSYSASDRTTMQREVNQMLQEINRIAGQTEFNGKKLIDGTGGSAVDPHEKLVIDGLRGAWLRESEDLVETYYGLTGNGTSFEIILENDAVGGQLASVKSYYSGSTIQKHELRVDMEDFAPPDSMTGGTAIDRVIAHEMVHGLMADNMNSLALPTWFKEGAAEFIHGADERVVGDFTTAAAMTGAIGGGAWASDSLHYSSAYIAVRYLHEQASGGIKSIMTELSSGASLDAAIAATSSYADTTAFLTDYTGAAGRTYLQGLVDGGYLTNADTGAIGGADADGGAIRTAASVIPDTGGFSLDPLAGFAEVWPTGFDKTHIATQNLFDLQVGENAGDSLKVKIGAASVSALGLSGIDVANNAGEVISKVDQALTYLNEQRGAVGATHNRLGHIIAVNAINVETTSDARSRILDADYAQETRELTRRQILIQSGQSMLVQANAAPRQVLSLLTG